MENIPHWLCNPTGLNLSRNLVTTCDLGQVTSPKLICSGLEWGYSVPESIILKAMGCD